MHRSNASGGRRGLDPQLEREIGLRRGHGHGDQVIDAIEFKRAARHGRGHADGVLAQDTVMPVVGRIRCRDHGIVQPPVTHQPRFVAGECGVHAPADLRVTPGHVPDAHVVHLARKQVTVLSAAEDGASRRRVGLHLERARIGLVVHVHVQRAGARVAIGERHGKVAPRIQRDRISRGLEYHPVARIVGVPGAHPDCLCVRDLDHERGRRVPFGV